MKAGQWCKRGLWLQDLHWARRCRNAAVVVGSGLSFASNLDLAERLIGRCRETQTILPGISTIERLCAEMLVKAERRIDATIVAKLDLKMRCRLDVLLDDMVTDQLTRFVWLRQFEVANQLLDRLERLQKLDLPTDILNGLPSHKIKRLRRHGERYFTSDLRKLSDDKRYAIMAVCVIEWHAAISDAVVETHDRIVGRTWREASAREQGRTSMGLAEQAPDNKTISIDATYLKAHRTAFQSAT